MFLEMNPGLIPVLIAVGVIFVPTIILLIVVVVKRICKYSKKSKTLKASKNLDLEEYFGKGNIKNVDVVMQRVNVEVKDVEMVNFDKLKERGVSALVVGNVIKCASKEFADEVMFSDQLGER